MRLKNKIERFFSTSSDLTLNIIGFILLLIIIGTTYFSYNVYASYRENNRLIYIKNTLQPMPYDLGRELSDKEKAGAVTIADTDKVSAIIALILNREDSLPSNLFEFHKVYYAYASKINYDYDINQFEKHKIDTESFYFTNKKLPDLIKEGSKYNFLKSEISISFTDKYDFDQNSLPVKFDKTLIKSKDSNFYLKLMTNTSRTQPEIFKNFTANISEPMWHLSKDSAEKIININNSIKGIAYFDISKSDASGFLLTKGDYIPRVQLLAYCTQIDFLSADNNLLFSTGCNSLNRQEIIKVF